MSTFADSSAIVKLYADEEGTEVVQAAPTLVVAQLARLEVPAALWRKHRMGELAAEDAQLLTADFEADWFGSGEEDPRFVVAAITDAVLDDAARSCATHRLRAYDAVHLATAIAVRTADSRCTTMAVFDQNLRAAAAAEGFALLPPS